MIIVMQSRAADAQIEGVVHRIEDLGLKAHISRGEFRTIIGAIGDETLLKPEFFAGLAGVETVMPIMKPYKLASRDFHADDTVLQIGPFKAGGHFLSVIAGPCAIESEDQFHATARVVRDAGGVMLRGGAFKPRTSPYSFQGLGEQGLKILQSVGAQVGLPTVTEVVDVREVEMVARYADVLQVGARNMQNFRLLTEVGQAGKPVLLKRNPAATTEELLMSAEYVLAEGNRRVMLCERGVRGFDQATRYLLDLAAVPVIQAVCHLPVIVDPSHATGRRELVPAMALAAVAAGAHGVFVEVHPDPEKALSDGPQQLTPDAFRHMMAELAPIAEAVGRELQKPNSS
ncbi:MAG: 3-deoxy-7-phosphoheptulonate synthase [Planctomycetes bacterium DG_20]|nr:MAG: 3-deoxy-7-phosphoheptulonate synthase [Planctomycetes bacterium DG_20]